MTPKVDDCPFLTADRILQEETGRFDAALVEIHAEATSEKIALGRHLAGRASIVVGTHTHVPTADVTTVLSRRHRLPDRRPACAARTTG